MGKRKKTKKPIASSSGEPAAASPFGGLSSLAGALPSRPVEEAPPPRPQVPSGPDFGRMKVVLRRQRSGRGGKTVTRVEGLELTATERKALAKRLKKKLGCGCSIEGQELVLLGDLEERAAAFFEGLGVRKVVLGSR